MSTLANLTTQMALLHGGVSSINDFMQSWKGDSKSNEDSAEHVETTAENTSKIVKQNKKTQTTQATQQKSMLQMQKESNEAMISGFFDMQSKITTSIEDLKHAGATAATQQATQNKIGLVNAYAQYSAMLATQDSTKASQAAQGHILHFAQQSYVAQNQIATEIVKLHGFMANDSAQQTQLRVREMKAERHQNLNREQRIGTIQESANKHLGLAPLTTRSALETMSTDRNDPQRKEAKRALEMIKMADQMRSGTEYEPANQFLTKKDRAVVAKRVKDLGGLDDKGNTIKGGIHTLQFNELEALKKSRDDKSQIEGMPQDLWEKLTKKQRFNALKDSHQQLQKTKGINEVRRYRTREDKEEVRTLSMMQKHHPIETDKSGNWYWPAADYSERNQTFADASFSGGMFDRISWLPGNEGGVSTPKKKKKQTKSKLSPANQKIWDDAGGEGIGSIDDSAVVTGPPADDQVSTVDAIGGVITVLGSLREELVNITNNTGLMGHELGSVYSLQKDGHNAIGDASHDIVAAISMLGGGGGLLGSAGTECCDGINKLVISNSDILKLMQKADERAIQQRKDNLEALNDKYGTKSKKGGALGMLGDGNEDGGGFFSMLGDMLGGFVGGAVTAGAGVMAWNSDWLAKKKAEHAKKVEADKKKVKKVTTKTSILNNAKKVGTKIPGIGQVLVIADAADKRKDGQGAGEAIVNATADVVKDLGWLLTAGNYQPTDSDVLGNNLIGQQTRNQAYRSGGIPWMSGIKNYAEADALVNNLHGGYRDVPFMRAGVDPTLRNKRRAIKLDNSSMVDSTRGILGNRPELAKLSLKELEAFSAVLTFDAGDRKELQAIIKAKQELRTVKYNIGVFGPGAPIFGEPGSANAKKKVIKTETSSSSYKESSQDGIVQLSDFPSYVEAFARADELNKTHPRPDGASWKVNIKGIPQVNKVSTSLPPELSDIVGGGFDVNKPSRKTLLNSKLNAHEKYNDGLAGIKQFLHGAVDKEMGSGFMGFNPMKSMAHSMLSRELSQYNDPSKVNSGMLAGTRAMMVDKMTGEVHPEKIKYILERFDQFASKFENYSMAEADLKRLETPDVGLATDAATALKHADDGPNNSLGVNIHNWDGFTSLVGSVLWGSNAMAGDIPYDPAGRGHGYDNDPDGKGFWDKGTGKKKPRSKAERDKAAKGKDKFRDDWNKRHPNDKLDWPDAYKPEPGQGDLFPEEENFMGIPISKSQAVGYSSAAALMYGIPKMMNQRKTDFAKAGAFQKMNMAQNFKVTTMTNAGGPANAFKPIPQANSLYSSANPKGYLSMNQMDDLKGAKMSNKMFEQRTGMKGSTMGWLTEHTSSKHFQPVETMIKGLKFLASAPFQAIMLMLTAGDAGAGSDLVPTAKFSNFTNLMPNNSVNSSNGGGQPVIINNNQSSNVNNSSAIVANTTAHAPALPSGIGSSIIFD